MAKFSLTHCFNFSSDQSGKVQMPPSETFARSTSRTVRIYGTHTRAERFTNDGIRYYSIYRCIVNLLHHSYATHSANSESVKCIILRLINTFYPHMPIGMLGIYRLLLVCICVCVCRSRYRWIVGHLSFW